MSYIDNPGCTVEIRRAEPHAVYGETELGVIIHGGMTWLMAYFPGDPENLADPADPTSIRIVRMGDVIACRDLADCKPAWVIRTWNHLRQAGAGLLLAPQAVRIWALTAALAQHCDDTVTSLFTRMRLERWIGRPLTDADLDRLNDAIDHSTIPEAIGAIVDAMDGQN